MHQDAAGYKVFTSEELQEILQKHQLWLDGEPGGERANLYRANLESANLYRANLESANLESANLYRANLESANLYRANLESANLESANLYRAKYGDVTLRGFFQIGPIGSRGAMLQVFGIGGAGFVFRTGCFNGSLEEFAAIVERIHGDNEHGVKYTCAIEFARQMLPPVPAAEEPKEVAA